MRVEGDRSFAAPREEVWRVLNDPASMAKTMPGVESFDIHDDRRWRANVKIPLGLGGLKMSVDMEKIEEREPEFARLAIKGNGVGAILSMSTAFELSEAGELDDYGPPAESTPEPEPAAGTSGADEGVSPLAPETYEPEPEGPTTSTEG